MGRKPYVVLGTVFCGTSFTPSRVWVTATCVHGYPGCLSPKSTHSPRVSAQCNVSPSIPPPDTQHSTQDQKKPSLQVL